MKRWDKDRTHFVPMTFDQFAHRILWKFRVDAKISAIVGGLAIMWRTPAGTLCAAWETTENRWTEDNHHYRITGVRVYRAMDRSPIHDP